MKKWASTWAYEWVNWNCVIKYNSRGWLTKLPGSFHLLPFPFLTSSPACYLPFFSLSMCLFFYLTLVHSQFDWAKLYWKRYCLERFFDFYFVLRQYRFSVSSTWKILMKIKEFCCKYRIPYCEIEKFIDRKFINLANHLWNFVDIDRKSVV